MRIRVLLVAGVLAPACLAQDPEGDLEILKGLLETPVLAATLVPTPIRASPGILTVVSRAPGTSLTP